MKSRVKGSSVNASQATKNVTASQATKSISTANTASNANKAAANFAAAVKAHKAEEKASTKGNPGLLPLGEGADLSSAAVEQRTHSSNPNCEGKTAEQWQDCWNEAGDFLDGHTYGNMNRKSKQTNFAAEPRPTKNGSLRTAA